MAHVKPRRAINFGGQFLGTEGEGGCVERAPRHLARIDAAAAARRRRQWRSDEVMDQTVSVPLRAGKRMKKRKELDALASAGKKRRLLQSASSEEHEDWPRGRPGAGRRPLLRRRACAALLRACTATLVFACVVATLTVMWLFVDIRDQVAALRSQLQQVAAGNQDVPEALQKCHSLSKALQQNQTALHNRILFLTAQLGNFSSQLTLVQTGLHSVENQLKDAPQLVNVPQTVKELSSSIATFGSQIQDLSTKVENLKSLNSKNQENTDVLLQNVTTIKGTVDLLLNNSHQPQRSSQDLTEEKEAVRKQLTQLSLNITKINETLNEKLLWISEDEGKDHKAIEELKDMGQNVISRVTTLEGSCAKLSAQTVILNNVANLTDTMNQLEKQIHDFDLQLTQLRLQNSQLSTNTSAVSALVSGLQLRLNQLSAQIPTSPPQDSVQRQDPASTPAAL